MKMHGCHPHHVKRRHCLGHGHHFRRRFLTKEEKVERLKRYAESLKKELSAVEEKLEKIQSE